MPTCQNCSTTWTMKETMKSSSVLGIRMTCPHCGAAQYVSKQTRKNFSLAVFFVMLLNLLIPFGISPWYVFGSYLVFFPFLFYTYYKHMKLSNEEEPLF
ncbi:CXXC-20-CXXC protein [Alkalibacillus filiformis]|uniref:CXXC-20-CXXC protein n=1 Tax=Alkalibacillus filiformis TaxID=200990 RepID=A0ABU0DSF6_9BACI|nr:TIGR04104 family putative zinc finger protein [Alkalibacillus filiformis]MDQ0351379.1 CXXC-20-CXXC protein [Alkalibacillus filiformis]